MCFDSALDLWPPGHFELGFFAFFFIPKSGGKYSHTNSNNFVMTLI